MTPNDFCVMLLKQDPERFKCRLSLCWPRLAMCGITGTKMLLKTVQICVTPCSLIVKYLLVPGASIVSEGRAISDLKEVCIHLRIQTASSMKY